MWPMKVPPDLVRVGVAVAHAGRAHDDDEVGPGVDPDPLGVGRERRGRVGPLDAGDDGRGRGHRLGDRQRLRDRLAVCAALRLGVGPDETGRDDEHGDDDLQREGLPRDAPPGRGRERPAQADGGAAVTTDSSPRTQ